MPRPAPYFITGTCTEVGKTLVSAALLYALAAHGKKTLALKPLAAGAHVHESGLRNEDALTLQRYQSTALSYQQVNPVLLEQPIAPHIAAQHENRRITISQLAGYCRGALMQSADVALIEGAGGWRVPVNRSENLSALPRELGCDVILVVGMRLGCLSQALLTAEAIARDGLRLKGWVANTICPDMMFVGENIQALRERLPAPLLGTLPRLDNPAPEVAARYLDVGSLIGSGS